MGAEELREQFLSALPPLHRKVRQWAATELAKRAAPDELAPDPVSKLSRLIRGLNAELVETDTLAARFSRDYAAARDDHEREEVLRAHIEETVSDRANRREDVRALDRHLAFDALKERIDKRAQKLLVLEETALRCLAGVLKEGAKVNAAPGLAEWLTSRASASIRVQVRIAAAQALCALISSSEEAREAAGGQLAELEELSSREGLNPFVQVEALRAVFLLSRDRGMRVFRKRFAGPYPSEKDFLFRREALNVAAETLKPEELFALFQDIALTDPSEYVRMGLCELSEQLGDLALPLLRRLSSTGKRSFDESPLVRARIVLTLSALAEKNSEGALQLIAEVLVHDGDPTVARIACEQLTRLADSGNEGVKAHAELLRNALAEVRARNEVTGVVLEAAAESTEAIATLADPARRAWTKFLRQQLSTVRSGGKHVIALRALPADLPPLPEDDLWLGSVLANLSRADVGVYAQRSKRKLTLWRGDRFQRRVWRVWHELKRPAPNKRQGFIHTVGRVVPGTLRAHPAHMDEITETMVPGERVHVPSQGSWARHLPTVGDLLDLPLSGRPVHLFSSHGVTTITPAASFAKRLHNRVRLSFSYAHYASLRLSALNGTEGHTRARYAEEVARELGVTFKFTPWNPKERAPSLIGSLFPNVSAPNDQDARYAIGGLQVLALSELWRELSDRKEYFFGHRGNGPLALAIFTAALFTWFLASAYLQRRRIREARAKIPLCVGGWGTRGKSGTERLKAALFSGLGFEVFAKTTGSEAMFVHSAPGGMPSEFFIFRPYDKATIWEQRDMVELGAELKTEVFLWECMALQPGFVEMLQNDWMKDDFATLTNAYPDHEDIQGPAGMNVAEVITNFMPEDGVVLTSEDHFLPLFKDKAKEKRTRLRHAPLHEAELIPQEVLALFPYQEHPRNMALVANLADELGVSRSYAIALMAEHVQPEIGVLKTFPEAKVAGRRLSFINGHSANERTGFMNNWLRTGLDKVDPEREADRAVITVINNRWDRVARSEVFARIMVEDACADRHVLIGTNLEGLQKYVRHALDQYLERTELVTSAELQTEAGRSNGMARLGRELSRLKIISPRRDGFVQRVNRYAGGAGLTFEPSLDLLAGIEQALTEAGTELSVAKVRAELSASLGSHFDAAFKKAAIDEDAGLPEVLAPATVDEVKHHALYLLARMTVHARLRALIATERDAKRVHEKFRAAHRELFLEQLVPVPNSQASGDHIVQVCARSVAPGLRVSIMGAQNIKGTGLDWVYRWLALDRVKTAIGWLGSKDPETRRRALDSLETFDDYGLVDAGLAAVALPQRLALMELPEEQRRLRLLIERVTALHQERLAALESTAETTAAQRAIEAIETVFDYLHSVRRKRASEVLMRDLADGRISHPRAAQEMRKLYERQKGGWLLPEWESLTQRLSRSARRISRRTLGRSTARTPVHPKPAIEPVVAPKPQQPVVVAPPEPKPAERDLHSP